MKRVIFVVMLIGIAAIAFAQNGVIKELVGEVELKSAGASAFVPAAAGSVVAKDTVVSTGFKSIAVITVGSSVITVRPLTRLTLAEIQTASGAENINVNLKSGSVKVDVKPPAGSRVNFTVQSASATASVRGTSFEFDTVNLKTFEGKVDFSGKFGAPVIVHARDASFIGKDGKAIDPDVAALGNIQPPPLTEDRATSAIVVDTGRLSDVSIEVGY